MPFEANKSARFLIPAIPLLALAAAFVLCRWPRTSFVALAIATVHLIVSWPSINNQYHFSTGWRMVMHISWKTALRIQPEDDSSSWQVQPPLDLRKETNDQLKKSGIHYIQFDRQAWFAEPYRGDFANWGFHQIGATPDSILLQVD